MGMNISRVSANIPRVNAVLPKTEVQKASVQGGNSSGNSPVLVSRGRGDQYPFALDPPNYNQMPKEPNQTGTGDPKTGDPGSSVPSQETGGGAGNIEERGYQSFGIGDIFSGGNNMWGGLGGPSDPGDNKIQPAPIDKGGNEKLPYGFSQASGLNYSLLTPSAQKNYDSWKNAVVTGTNPQEAVKNLGIDSNLKKLTTVNGIEQWQFRVSQGVRISYLFDPAEKAVNVIGIGHT